VGSCQHHLARLNTPERPIANKYREEKTKNDEKMMMKYEKRKMKNKVERRILTM